MTSKSARKHLRPYEKPRLRTVELAAKEVLAVGCKQPSDGINAGSGPPCLFGSCTTPANS